MKDAAYWREFREIRRKKWQAEHPNEPMPKRKNRVRICKCGAEMDHRSEMCSTCRLASFIIGTDKRKCTVCQEVKSITEFRMRTRKIPRPRSVCKVCECIASRKYKKLNPERTNFLRKSWQEKNPEAFLLMKARRSARAVGVKAEDVEKASIAVTSIKNCQICGVHISEAGVQHKYRLCIDHDHKTGSFRGVLCCNCNTGIGYFFDNPDRLRSAALYLDNHLAHSEP